MARMINKKSFTLIECVLAMCLCVLVVDSLGNILRVANTSGHFYREIGKDLQGMRLLLFRMASEIRYAERLVTLTSSMIEFETRYLEDDNDDVEIIKYEYVSGPNQVRRTVDAGTTVMMALNIGSMDFMGYKWDDVNDEWDTATESDATGVGISLSYRTYSNPYGYVVKEVPVNTFIQLRNIQ